jgi:tRNA (adenine37-N6)-methyltransferase
MPEGESNAVGTSTFYHMWAFPLRDSDSILDAMGLLSRLKALLPERPSFPPQEPVSYRPIGVVRNRLRSPRAEGWQDLRSDIIFKDELETALQGLEGFSHVIVVFDMNQVPESERRLTASLPGAEGPQRGVLTTRSQLRPNAIGVSVVSLLHRRKAVLRVRGLDALDGTPVLDIKPYLPPYDAVADARLPDWAVGS